MSTMEEKIVFFEVQDWEIEILKSAFPGSKLVHEKLSEENSVNYSDSEIISCFVYSDLSKSILENFPKLRHIATRSTGFDHIATDYCNERKITVSNVPEYGSNTVAEHTFALILSLTRKIYQSVSQAKRLNFNHKEIRGVDLHGKTLGIIGMGKIGVNVLRIAHGFGMNLIVNTRSRNDELREKYDFKYVDLDELLRSSDVISLHLPLFPETKHIINMDNLSLIKNGCYLINTARGGLVDTRTLIEGLNNNTFAGVALDVLEEEKELTEEAAILTQHFQKDANMETLVMDHYLINHPKVLITPHNAFNSIEALARIENTTIENIKAFLEGKDINLVTSHS